MYISEDAISIFKFAGFIVFLLILIFFGGNRYARYQCENFAEITNKETRYANFDTCYVKTERGFERWDEYKLRATASEGLGRINKP